VQIIQWLSVFNQIVLGPEPEILDARSWIWVPAP